MVLHSTHYLNGQTPTLHDKVVKMIPPAPTQASLGKFTETPVSLYTGIPQISIPIYTLSARDISIDIALSYHAGGVKVDEQASWVGMNWNLIGGGSITRSVAGVSDFGTGGYINGELPLGPINTAYDGQEPPSPFPPPSPYPPTAPPPIGGYAVPFFPEDDRYCGSWSRFVYPQSIGTSPVDLLKRLNRQTSLPADGEPDLFTVTVPGKSFSFRFDHRGNPHFSEFENVVIVRRPTNESIPTQEWVIRTSDGYEYTFGGVGAVDVSTSSGLSTITGGDNIIPPYNGGWCNGSFGTRGFSTGNTEYDRFVSTWHLVAIVSPKGERLSYEYESYSASYTVGVSFQEQHFRNWIYPGYSGSCGAFASRTHTQSTSNLQIDGFQLKSITSQYLQIRFQSGSRCDIPGDKNLKSIAVYDLFNSKTIKSFILNQSYSHTDPTLFPTNCSSISPLQSRLWLHSVQEISGNNTISIPPYKFEYNSSPLPEKFDQFKSDVFGNRKLSVDEILSTKPSNGGPIIILPNDKYSLYTAGTLTKIIYPTCGSTEYTLEPNKFSPSTQSDRELALNNGLFEPEYIQWNKRNIQASKQCSFPCTNGGCNGVSFFGVTSANGGFAKILSIDAPSSMPSYVNNLPPPTKDTTSYIKIYRIVNGIHSIYKVFKVSDVQGSTFFVEAGSYYIKLFCLEPQNGARLHLEFQLLEYITQGPYLTYSIGSGVRVSGIISKDSDGRVLKRSSYDYTTDGTTTSGRIMSIPVIYYADVIGAGNNSSPNGEPVFGFKAYYITRAKRSVVPLSGSAGGSLIGYDQVTEKLYDASNNILSMRRTQFTNFASSATHLRAPKRDVTYRDSTMLPFVPPVYPAINAYGEVSIEYIYWTLIRKFDFVTAFGISGDVFTSRNGKPIMVEDYASNGKIVKRVENAYKLRRSKRLYGYKVKGYFPDFPCCKTDFSIGPQSCNIYNACSPCDFGEVAISSFNYDEFVLDSTSVANFSSDLSSTLSSINRVKYAYDSYKVNRPTRQIDYGSDGVITTWRYKYLGDFSFGNTINSFNDVYLALISSNRIDIPIEIFRTMRINQSQPEYLTDASFMSFKRNSLNSLNTPIASKLSFWRSATPRLLTSFVQSSFNHATGWQIDPSYVQEIDYINYDKWNNPVLIGNKGSYVQSLWGYEGHRLLSESLTPVQTKVLSASFEPMRSQLVSGQVIYIDFQVPNEIVSVGTISNPNDAASGKYSIRMPQGSYLEVALLPGDYSVSFNLKSGSSGGLGAVDILKEVGAGVFQTVLNEVSSSSWRSSNRVISISCANSMCASGLIKVRINSNNTNGVLLDDLVIGPVNSLTSLVTHDPAIGVVKMLGESRNFNLYSYDNFGRLESIAGSLSKIKSSYTYEYCDFTSDFSVNSSVLYRGYPATFTAKGSNALQYEWRFSNEPGVVYNGATVSRSWSLSTAHPYNVSVELTARRPGGEVVKSTKSYVVSTLPLNLAITPPEGLIYSGSSTNLVGSISGGREPYVVAWKIGNNAPVQFSNITSSSHNYAYSFTSSGNCPVTFSVTDADGKTTQVSISLSIMPDIQLSLFAPTGVDYYVNSPLTFNSTSVNATSYCFQWWLSSQSAPTINSCNNYSNQAFSSKSYTFSAPGSYSVVCRVIDGVGRSRQVSHPVTIYSPPQLTLSSPQYPVVPPSYYVDVTANQVGGCQSNLTYDWYVWIPSEGSEYFLGRLQSTVSVPVPTTSSYFVVKCYVQGSCPNTSSSYAELQFTSGCPSCPPGSID